MRKLITCILLLFLLMFVISCGKADVSKHFQDAATPTGYPSGEYQHLYLLYNDVMYTYDTSGTGRWENGTKRIETMGLTQVAEVKIIDNHNPPTQNLQATRMAIGTPIYAKEGEDFVYVLLEDDILWRLEPCDPAADPRNE